MSATETTVIFLFPHTYIFQHEKDDLLKIGANIGPPINQFIKEVHRLRETYGNVCLIPAYFSNGQMAGIAKQFLPKTNDRIIDSGVRISIEGLISGDPDELNWNPEEPDFGPVIEAIDSPKFVIAGFHIGDCVFRFLLAAESAGRKAVVAVRATDFPFVHQGLAYLGREVMDMDEIPSLADFDQYSALLERYLTIIES